MSEAVLRFVVSEADTAIALGSGDLPVLATPRLLAWCEAVTCAAMGGAVGEGQTSVGTRVSLEHLAASAVGAEVEVTASRSYADGRLHRFSVTARAVVPPGQPVRLLGSGEVTRVVVDVERFMGRLG